MISHLRVIGRCLNSHQTLSLSETLRLSVKDWHWPVYSPLSRATNSSYSPNSHSYIPTPSPPYFLVSPSLFRFPLTSLIDGSRLSDAHSSPSFADCARYARCSKTTHHYLRNLPRR